MSNRNYRNYQKEKNSNTETVDKTEEKNETVVADGENDTAVADGENDTAVADGENDTAVVETNAPIENPFEEVKPEEPVKQEIGKVNCIRLKIRNKPSMSGSIVCLARVGDELAIDTSKFYDGWLKVTTVDDLEGFCRPEFITVI